MFVVKDRDTDLFLSRDALAQLRLRFRADHATRFATDVEAIEAAYLYGLTRFSLLESPSTPEVSGGSGSYGPKGERR